VFDGFAADRIDTGKAEIFVRHGGSGPAIVLLHGHPRTHATWHRVARLLAPDLTVVCPDLRGYGRSTSPPPRPDHSQASKRAMALDVVAVMRALGHERFAVVGHDRGALVAMRVAMDHPDVVSRLVEADGIPVLEHLERADARFAQEWWHWFFFAQPDKPERAILADPETWYGHDRERMGPENHDDFLAAINDPATVVAMLEDYRAGLGVDREADEADRAEGRRIRCPLLVLWSTEDDMERLYGDVPAIWRAWADDVRGAPIHSGHHMAEEAPEELADELLRFLA